MYRINNRSEAIKRVQQYLSLVDERDVFVAPTGVFDDNTRLAVVDFQRINNLSPTGEVDRLTFEALFSQYRLAVEKNKLNNSVGSFLSFPVLPGEMSGGMNHINRSMARLLDYYGITHRLRESSFYSDESAKAVKALRRIYLLPDLELIDEVFYGRMVSDHNAVGRFKNNFI